MMIMSCEGAGKEQVHQTFKPCRQQDVTKSTCEQLLIKCGLTVKDQLIFANRDVAMKRFCLILLKGQQIN